MSDMGDLIKGLKEDSKHFIELSFSLAKFNRSYYEGLLEQGFTEEQAFELVKTYLIAMFKK